MNIFVILIMGIMLATYQYFTSRRSSDTVLNKDELRLQAELDCMKQYHNFASTRNEYITDLKKDGIEQMSVSLKVDANNPADKNHVDYTCTGKEDIYTTKYCLNGSGRERVGCDSLIEHKTDCTDAESSSNETSPVGFHCVSTTKWKNFGDDKYLATQIIKNGINIATSINETNNSEDDNTCKGGNPKCLIKKFYANFSAISEEDHTSTPIGLVSCVNACKVLKRIELDGLNCEEGSSPVQMEDGSYVCAKSTNASPCTAHEKEYEKLEDVTSAVSSMAADNKTKYCTQDESSGKYCCAINFYAGNTNNTVSGGPNCTGNSRPNNCCPRDTIPEWQGNTNSMKWDDNITRFWTCKDQGEANNCKGKVYMKIVDERGNLITSLGNSGYVQIDNPGIIQYEQTATGGKYSCTLEQTNFMKTCKNFENTTYSFLKVTGTNYKYKGNMPITTTDNEILNEFIPLTNLSYKNVAPYSTEIWNNSDKMPTCWLVSQNNAKSAENCNPCQYATFNKNANKWTCTDYTKDEIKAGKRGDTILIGADGTSGTLVKTTAKGVKACLSTCSTEQLKKIRSGTLNGKYWGLNYNQQTKMWSCFTCDKNTHYNFLWHCSDKKDPTQNCGRDIENPNIMDERVKYKHDKPDILNNVTTAECTCDRQSDWKTNIEGKCFPYSCDDSFQIMHAGACYTKWCHGDVPSYARVGGIKEVRCGIGDTIKHPWIVFNPLKSCIYCVKPLQ